jgi:hypothetical protein
LGRYDAVEPRTEDARLKCFDYCHEEPRMFAAHELLRSNTERISLLAARWSIDPTAINAARMERSQGIAGEFSF